MMISKFTAQPAGAQTFPDYCNLPFKPPTVKRGMGENGEIRKGILTKKRGGNERSERHMELEQKRVDGEMEGEM